MNNASKYQYSPLGLLPEEWEIKKFEECCSKILDGTHFSPKSTSGPYKYITSKNIRSEGLDLGNIGHISEEEHRVIFKRCPVVFGDILLTKDGANTGNCCKNSLSEPFSLLSSVAVLRSKEEMLDNDFLFQFIKSEVGQSKIADAIGGQAITRITLEKIRAFNIPLPPLPEQRKIAALLATWDKAIASHNSLIAALEARHRSLMQQLLAGRTRLKGFEGEWKVSKAGDIFKNSSKKNNSNEPLLSSTQEFGIIPRDMLEGRVTMPSSETSSYKLVVPGDFVISLRSFQGGLEYSNHRGIVSPAYTILKQAQPVDDAFYRFYFKSAVFISRLGVAVIGIRDGKQISYDDFCAIKIPFPSLPEQTAIAKILITSETEISGHRRKLAKLKEQKKGLMQILLTGKLRVTI